MRLVQSSDRVADLAGIDDLRTLRKALSCEVDPWAGESASSGIRVSSSDTIFDDADQRGADVECPVGLELREVGGNGARGHE